MSRLKPMTRSFVLVAGVVGLTMLMGVGYAAWRYFDVPPLDRYSAVIAQMAAQKIQGDASGIVDLSKTFPGLTPKDTADLTWRDDGSFVAMFPTSYGQGTQLVGLLYTSRPLREGDTRIRDGGIDLNQRLITVGGYGALLVEKQINPNWYHVSYHMR